MNNCNLLNGVGLRGKKSLPTKSFFIFLSKDIKCVHIALSSRSAYTSILHILCYIYGASVASTKKDVWVNVIAMGNNTIVLMLFA